MWAEYVVNMPDRRHSAKSCRDRSKMVKSKEERLQSMSSFHGTFLVSLQGFMIWKSWWPVFLAKVCIERSKLQNLERRKRVAAEMNPETVLPLVETVEFPWEIVLVVELSEPFDSCAGWVVLLLLVLFWFEVFWLISAAGGWVWSRFGPVWPLVPCDFCQRWQWWHQ